MTPEQAKTLAELCDEKLRAARSMLSARIITRDEYVDVIDGLRKIVDLPPLPADARAELIARDLVLL